MAEGRNLTEDDDIIIIITDGDVIIDCESEEVVFTEETASRLEMFPLTVLLGKSVSTDCVLMSTELVLPLVEELITEGIGVREGLILLVGEGLMVGDGVWLVVF